jgi:NAD-dependent deacetylase
MISHARRIVFFGGAGVSTASGIPDFRSEGGLYSADYGGAPPETILSASFFALHTAEFYDFYRRYMVHPEAKPNAVHRYLYKLEKEDRLRGIVTQNIDGLHKMAGNKRVYELHGSVHENYCVDCEKSYPLEKIMQIEGVPRCESCGGIIKPWVVLYGEMPDKYTGIGACREISGADCLIVAGTSLQVEPAASYIDYFTGRALVGINREPTPADDRAALVMRGDVAEIFAGLE